MMGSIWITIQNKEGEFSHCYPSTVEAKQMLNFNTGSQLMGDSGLGQWNCGSCGVIGENNGIMVGIRKVEAENRVKIDIIELEKWQDKWKRERMPPRNHYSDLHYQKIIPQTVIVEWEIDGKRQLIGSTSI